ncbi:MAG: Fic family protein [Kofleriaceae bacterium]
MTELSIREHEFLRESNAIEDIVNIDYHAPQNAQLDRGHVGAYADAQDKSRRRVELTTEDICRWQRWITSEQIEFAHPLPGGGSGALRSPRYPHDVMVGSHIAPSFEEVPQLIDALLADLNARVACLGPAPADFEAADALGEFLQRFEAIHPFVDGNGRTGRLLANYIATVHKLPIVIFRVSERAAFYQAHRSKMAMRVFMADKIREAIYWPGRGVLERQAVGASSDIYDGLVIERHDLLAKQNAWRAASVLGTAASRDG